ncbi:MAG: GNAT family N-acetyltransferase [Planctomycetes bacterium]|nr:GNAT family N-acetyltransferase [Planctomycetota bacterium]
MRRLDRAEVQPFLPLLDEWLLDGAIYGVQHTWPQLYRNDGAGAFFVLTDGDVLLSHCAYRTATLRDGDDERTVALLGSVATAPMARGRGLATHVLGAALASLPDHADVLLWAERPELYARHGFCDSGADRCLMLARRPRRELDGARFAEITDHASLHALHQQKPRRIARSSHTMSTLLTTPGMATVVLERDGVAVAYACCGKGADLQGHWHELGGSDEDLAQLIPAAMHMTDQIEAALLLPPYRDELAARLAPDVVAELGVPGPMVRGAAAGPCWVDGLDSV